MGMSISGGMIVGTLASDLVVPDSFDGEHHEWIEVMCWDCMAPHYDADVEQNYVGYMVNDILVSEIDGKWLDNIKYLARVFEEESGCPATLIGTQNVL